LHPSRDRNNIFDTTIYWSPTHQTQQWAGYAAMVRTPYKAIFRNIGSSLIELFEWFQFWFLWLLR